MASKNDTDCSKEASVTRCNCQELLLHGFIHNTEKRKHLSQSVPTEVHVITSWYYGIDCYNKYFDVHSVGAKPTWLTNTTSFSHFLLKLAKMISKLLSRGTKCTQWKTIYYNRYPISCPLNTTQDIQLLIRNNVQTYLAVNFFNSVLFQ